MGFRELPHTADVALEVWADDLPSLFSEAARAVNFVAGARLGTGPRQRRSLRLEAIDDESLLVAFLTEMVIAQEQEHLGFDEFELTIEDRGLHGEARGSELTSLAKPIKAVTFHNLSIRRADRGLEVEVVLDV